MDVQDCVLETQNCSSTKKKPSNSKSHSNEKTGDEMDSQTVFDVYTTTELEDILESESQEFSVSKVALAPLDDALSFLLDNGTLTVDYIRSMRIFSLNAKDMLHDELDPYSNFEQLLKDIESDMEKLSRDPDYAKFIILMQFPLSDKGDLKDIERMITLAHEEHFEMYPPKDDDMETEYLLFIYSNNKAGANLNTILFQNMNNLIQNNQMADMHNYYISYMLNEITEEGIPSGKMNSIIVGVQGKLDHPDKINALRDMIAEKMHNGADPGSIFIIAFSYMGPVEQPTQEDSSPVIHVALITYLHNGVEKEYTSTTDVDLLDPNYAEHDLAKSIIYDLDNVNEDDDIEIIDVVNLGTGTGISC